MDSYSYDPNTTPVLMPPAGVVPNFINPDSIAYVSRNVSSVFLSLMLAFLIMRLYSRSMITRSCGIDDVLHVLAGASIIVFCGILISLLDHPNGRHLWDVPLSVMTDSYLKVNFTFVIMGAVSNMLVKVALLSLYLRLFGTIQKVRFTIYACMGIIASFYLSTMIAELVVGVPRHGDGWQAAQSRYGPFGLDVSVVRGVFGVVSDFAIIAIPLTQTFKIQVATRKKIVLICVFLTGLFACASSIISCVQRFGEQDNEDYTWANTMPNAFSTIELTVGHICGSLPALPAMINHIGKNETFLSIILYVRSHLTKRGDTEDSPGNNVQHDSEKLHRDSHGRLISLKTFVQRARLATFLTRPRTATSGRNFSNNDLESIDVDYHAQLKNVAAQDHIRHTEVANGGAELPQSTRQ